MKQILIVKPETISEEEKEKLKANSIVVVEHPEPSEVRIVTTMDGFDGNDVFMAAIEAIADIPSNTKAQIKFAEVLTARLKSKAR